MTEPPSPTRSSRRHRAAAVEMAVDRVVARALARLGWRPQIIAFPGYGLAPDPTGGGGWVRLLARVIMLPPTPRTGDEEGGRGWRRFLTVTVPDTDVGVRVGGRSYHVSSGKAGMVDAVVPTRLPAGLHEAELSVTGSFAVCAPLHVVGRDQGIGVVSDIDDTVMVTALPRPLLAAWNTFVRHESKRRPVPGMAAFLHELRAEDPDAPVMYVSTGAWNVAPSLAHFLERHGYPAGPLLLTDWGPTDEAWFRSGREHKRTSLRRLLRELPHLRWALVGDDGQHDPGLYEELVTEAPDRVRVVAIRQLSPAEQVLTHGLPTPLPEGQSPPRTARAPWLRAPDGAGLSRLLSGAQRPG
jgi:phosphatidate phosphatase APP1